MQDARCFCEATKSTRHRRRGTARGSRAMQSRAALPPDAFRTAGTRRRCVTARRQSRSAALARLPRSRGSARI